MNSLLTEMGNSCVLYPRRDGKSMNLTMIKKFLEIEIDFNGHPLPCKKRKNPVYFLGGKIEEKGIELDPLNIAKNKKFVEKYLGKCPVIYIDFKDCKADSSEKIINRLKKLIQDRYSENQFLLNS